MGATISVRALDSQFEPIQGNGQGAFITDLEAIAQILRTTILLFTQEWWENLAIGTPMFTEILGVAGTAKSGVISAALQERILGVPYVTQILNLQTTFNTATRAFTFSCVVATAFGTVNVTAQPSIAALNQ